MCQWWGATTYYLYAKFWASIGSKEREMVVCICRSISEKDIIDAILNGCGSFEQLIEEKDITNDCTTCFDAAKDVFEDKKKLLDI